MSKAFEPVSLFKTCWTRRFMVMDENGSPIYHLRASDCGTQEGCNACGPSCLNESYNVDVYTPDGVYVNSSTFVWPGCNCGGPLSERSNLLIRFPRDSSARQRTALIAGLMLVDYTAMEVHRLKDGSTSTTVNTGIKGGAPIVSEMER
jgi:hypothetical protein